MSKIKNSEKREDVAIFDINRYEEEDEEENKSLQVQLLTNIINIDIFQLFKHSQLIRENYQKNSIKHEITHHIQQLQSKYKIKDQSIFFFFKMIQEGNVEFNSDYYYDLYKLSHFFKVKSIQKFLRNYSKSHSKNLEFIVNLILSEQNEEADDDLNGIEKVSLEMENYLCTNINECLKNETFALLPISSIHRIIQKSDKNSISDELLFDFIIKSIESRNILFNFLDIKKLPKDKLDSLVDIFTENRGHFNYLPFDLEYVKSLINSNEEIEAQLGNLKKENKKLKSENKKIKEEQSQINQDNKSLQKQIKNLKQKEEELENQIDELSDQNKKLQNKLTSVNQKNKSLQKQIDDISEEKEELENKTNKLKEKNLNLENQVDQLKEDNAKIENQMNQLIDENEKLKSQVDELCEKNENLENRLNEMIEQNPSDKTIAKSRRDKKSHKSLYKDDYDILNIEERDVKRKIETEDDAYQSFAPKKEPIELNSENSIRIVFIFENKKFYPLRLTISLESTITDITRMISEKYSISSNEIFLKRKLNGGKQAFFAFQKVKDITEYIKENDASGKVFNIIYVEIIPFDSITKLDYNPTWNKKIDVDYNEDFV